jgi:hypothetical protein
MCLMDEVARSCYLWGVLSVIDCYYHTCATSAETLVTSLRIVIDPPRPPPFTYPLWFVDDRTTSGAATLMLGFWQQIGQNGIRNWLFHEYSTSRLLEISSGRCEGNMLI